MSVIEIVYFVICIISLLLSGLLILAIINAKQKSDLMFMKFRLENLRMMEFWENYERRDEDEYK